MNHEFGDTTLTKVFVGGLAWETPKEAMRDHFDKFGDILEAVIISDKLTGRSKGYGFVTFKEPDAAKKACEESTPVINGRRANCNLASLGARRPCRSSISAPPTPPPHHQPGSNGPSRSTTPVPPASHVQWYYPAAATPPLPASSAYHHQAVPYYGYTPNYNYVANDMNYNHKVSYNGGTYYSPQVYHQSGGGQATVVGPMYPLYHFHQSSQTMGGGLPAATAHHYYPATAPRPITSVPTKPHPSIAPNPGTRIGCR